MGKINDSDRKAVEEFIARKFDEVLSRTFELSERIGKPYNPGETLRKSREYGTKYRIKFGKI